ncbi:MAG: hypothetical protein LUG23_09420 [Oscillospiraceae bacterium]|nr:hypothetical protein [Oscillospiraceae bacterium]
MIKQVFDLDEYLGFCESFKDDLKYSDSHFIYSPDTLYSAFSRSDRSVYVVFDEDSIIGLFVLLILPEDRYAEMLTGFSKEEKAYHELVEMMKKKYAGFTMDFVFNPANRAIREFLGKKGALFYPEQVRMLAKAPSPYQARHRVELLSDKYEEQYRRMHTKDTYWTAERVLSAKDRFWVFVALSGDEIVGYLDVTYCFPENEPYDFKVKKSHENEMIEADLLSYALRQNLPNKMMYLVDANNEAEIAVLEAVGFERVEKQNSVTGTIGRL